MGINRYLLSQCQWLPTAVSFKTHTHHARANNELDQSLQSEIQHFMNGVRVVIFCFRGTKQSCPMGKWVGINSCRSMVGTNSCAVKGERGCILPYIVSDGSVGGSPRVQWEMETRVMRNNFQK